MALHFTTSYIEDALELFRQSKKLCRAGDGTGHRRTAFAPLDPETNSIAVIVKHLSGNMRSRWTDFLTTDGKSRIVTVMRIPRPTPNPPGSTGGLGRRLGTPF
jgi:hypothetical protein